MKYKVGDKIKIREWDDMENEFGLDIDCDIKTIPYFTRPMKEYCGKTLEITKITWAGNYKVKGSIYTFSDDMIVKKNKIDSFKIRVTNQKDRHAVLKKMEQDGIRWQNGLLPTKWKQDFLYGLIVRDEVLTFCSFDCSFDSIELKEITVSEYLNRKSEHIIIYRDGNSVIAKDRSTGKNAVAKCHPDDEFDFMVGAKLALERLSQPDEPKYYNGKVVCVKSSLSSLTVGKIYEVKDGQFKDDNGDVMPIYIKSFEDFDKHFLSKFIEIVEQEEK